MTRSKNTDHWWSRRDTEEVEDNVEGSNDSEVIVVGNGVDEGSKERVDSIFEGKTWHELELEINLYKNDRNSEDIS